MSKLEGHRAGEGLKSPDWMLAIHKRGLAKRQSLSAGASSSFCDMEQSDYFSSELQSWVVSSDI